MEFWVARVRAAAAHGPAAEGNGSTNSSGPAGAPADSGAGAEEDPSRAEAESAAANGSRKAILPSDLSQPANDKGPGAAADTSEGASSEKLADKGSCISILSLLVGGICTKGYCLVLGCCPTCTLASICHSGLLVTLLACHAAGGRTTAENGQKAAEPENCLSDTKNARKRKAKKARQRASRAQPAAQTVEVMQLLPPVPYPCRIFPCVLNYIASVLFCYPKQDCGKPNS